jgi:predicted nucleic acid-binding protein
LAKRGCSLNFAVINRLDILQAIFGQVVIPQAVYDETTGLGFPGSQVVLQAIASEWLQV